MQVFFLDTITGIGYIIFMARKPLSTKIELDLQKEIKKLAIDLERPLNDILEEAIIDFLKKHGMKPKK